MDRLENKFYPSPITVDTSGAQRMMQVFHDRLGSLEHLEQNNETWNVGFFNTQTMFTYSAPAKFKKTTGTLQLQLTKDNGEWKLLSFRILSDGLIL